METIIGLLFILLPVIFKLIGNKLEQSGKTDGAEKMRKIAQSFGDDNDDPFADWVNDEAVQEEPVPAVTEVRQPLPAEAEVKPVAMPKAVRQSRTILKEEKPARKKEKIDPKKLVIYSEIMNPKYKES